MNSYPGVTLFGTGDLGWRLRRRKGGGRDRRGRKKKKDTKEEKRKMRRSTRIERQFVKTLTVLTLLAPGPMYPPEYVRAIP